MIIMKLSINNLRLISIKGNLLSIKLSNYICKDKIPAFNYCSASKSTIKINPKFLINVKHTNTAIAIANKSLSTAVCNLAMFNVQDEDDFQQKVIKSDIPVVVDFHANWCGPCKILGPRLENVIGSKADKVHLAKIDIESASDLALEYGVSAVPSVIAIKNGKVVDKFVGLQDEARIDAFVRKLIEE